MKKANKNDVLSALKTGWAESAPRPRQTPWEESHLENIRKGCDQINRYLSTDKRLYVEAADGKDNIAAHVMLTGEKEPVVSLYYHYVFIAPGDGSRRNGTYNVRGAAKAETKKDGLTFVDVIPLLARECGRRGWLAKKHRNITTLKKEI